MPPYPRDPATITLGVPVVGDLHILKHRPARKAKPVMCATLFRACRSSLEAMHHCEFTPVPPSELTPRYFIFVFLLSFFFIRRNESDTGGEPIVSVQPVARYDYVMMLGVDVADQRLGAHAHVHRPMPYF